MPQEKKTFRLQNVSSPSLKIVKKTHTRWSQITKKRKKRQNSRQLTLEKEMIKKTTARIELRKLAEILEKKRIKRNCQVTET
jgi:hypothetical protein